MTNNAQNDVPQFFFHVRSVAARRGFTVSVIGNSAGDPIFRLNRIARKGPTLLVAAGFHGDEPAGCWGLLQYLDYVSQDALDRVNLTVLPLVNPAGMRRNQRRSLTGDPNRGYASRATASRSEEAECLVRRIDLLRGDAQDGFLSLHEDIEEDRFYIYTFEAEGRPGAFSQALLAAERRHFAPVGDGKVEGNTVRGGVVFGVKDGSFEHWLFDLGVPYTACTETPGRVPFDTRVSANADIANGFVSFFIQDRRS